MQSIKVFVVEDDVVYAEVLKHQLALNPEYEIETFSNGEELLNNLYKKPSLITLDYTLPDFSGMQLFKKIKEFDRDLPVVVISGQEDILTAVDLLKEGAYDYIVRPFVECTQESEREI
jgi:two-component system, NtrC family, response regulator AtoC